MALRPRGAGTYDERIRRAQRAQAMADQIRQRAMQPLEGRMVGRVYVAPSPWEGLSQLGQAWIGGRAARRADEEEQGIVSERQQKLADLIRDMPAVGQDDTATITELAGIDTGMASLVAGLRGRKETLAAQAAAQAEERAWREQQTEAEQAWRAQQAQAERELKAQLAAMTQANKTPPRPVAVIGADGKPTFVDPSQASGMTPYYPPKSNQANGRPQYDSGSDTWVLPPTEQYPQGSMSVSPGRMQAAQDLQYLANQFKGTDEAPGVMKSTPTGGFMGIKGKAATVTAYQDKAQFENMRQQISTALRKIFRIPGEGALSDREQAQYGLQLPSTNLDPAVNEEIINQLVERARIVTSGTGQFAPNAGQPDPFGLRSPQ